MTDAGGTVTAVVTDLTHDGLGVTEIDGRRTFVPGALPGETVRITRRRRRRRFVEADLVEIVEPSADRVEPGCRHFGRCGGCALQHLGYDAQVRFKQKVVADAFMSIAKLEPGRWLPPITGPQWGYRRRARLGARYVAGKGRVLVGFRERATSYVTDMDGCPVLVPPLDGAIADLAAAIGATTIRDRIPQAEISVGDGGGAIVVRVLAPPTPEDTARLDEFGARYGLDVYLQPSGPDSIRPTRTEPVALRYSLESFGLTFDFEPNDFVQVNGAVNRALVEAAVAAAELGTGDRVLDLYCGIGNITLPIATRADAVLGVEGDAALVARAVRNARRNGVANATFLAADLAQSDWAFFREAWDVVFLDPARAGAESAAAAMGRMAPRRVIYVSCHPGTLARDAATLVREHGYSLASVRVLDMFPNTHHVEAIAVFDAKAAGARRG